MRTCFIRCLLHHLVLRGLRAQTWGRWWRVGRRNGYSVHIEVLVRSFQVGVEAGTEKRAYGLGEGRTMGVFDIRREGTRGSEHVGRLEALTGGGQLCHKDVMDIYTKHSDRVDGQTHL